MADNITDSCDILIIGAGIFGTSTAYHLSQTYHDPSRITVVDRATCPSPLAASSDINKIVRADYSKLFYMDLAYEAMEGWQHDPVLSQFYHNTGWIALDEKGSDLTDRIRDNFRKSGKPDPSSDRTLEEVKTSWGGVLAGIDTTEFEKAYFNSIAGWADASLAVAAWMEIALSKGIQYVAGEATLATKDQKLIGVHVNGRLLTATKVLLAAGAWTPYLLGTVEEDLGIEEKNGIEHQIRTAGVCVAAFKLNEAEAQHYGQMPVLIYGSQGEVMPPNRDRMFKFTNANTFLNTQRCGKKEISIPRDNQSSVPARLKQQSIEIIRKRVPEMVRDDRAPDYWRLCWDAVSPDQNQLICRHPIVPNLYLATAGSFHSWKFLPNIGRYVINVLNGTSNGEEKDDAWSWKSRWSDRGAHPKVAPKGELRDFE